MPAQCRVASSLGDLEGHPNDVWGTVDYTSDKRDTVFFGLYGLPDFYSLWRHKGKRWILWAGSDIRHFTSGYWLDDKGKIRIDPKPLAQWISDNCESWVENEAERLELQSLGILSHVCPSFMGNISEYDLSYSYSERPKLYASVSGDDFELYGWGMIESLAQIHSDTEFHLYGNTKDWISQNKNVYVHGRVPKEQMNTEIKSMQGGFRPVKLDGFSEILAKSILWGQWPVSLIRYEHMLDFDQIESLKEKVEPNREGREHYRQILNNYPWNANYKS